MKSITKKEAHFSFSTALILALILFFIFILPLVACPLWGQVVQKKQLTEADYPKFGEMAMHTASPDGSWASFSMVYKSGKDTLFVSHSSGKKSYSFPMGSNGRFLGNDCFVYKLHEELNVVDLKTAQHQKIPSVKNYYCADTVNRLIALQSISASRSDLLVLDSKGRTIKNIESVESFLPSPGGRKIMYATQTKNLHSLGILDLGKEMKTSWIVENAPDNFHGMVWEKGSKAIAFLSSRLDEEHQKRGAVLFYRFDNEQLYRMDPEQQAGFPQDKILDDSGTYILTISEDLSRVFFGIRPKPIVEEIGKKVKPASAVEIWKGNAKYIYPMERTMGQFEKRPNLAVWFPLLNTMMPVSTPDLPKVMLTAKEQYAVLSHPQSYEPQFDYSGPRDFFIMDLRTGKKELFLKKKEVNELSPAPMPSPGGQYISYFRDDNWWAYELQSKKHFNLTEKMGLDLTGSVRTLYRNSPYGVAGWTPDDKEIVIYDQYDLWLVKPDGSSFRRITHGREKQIQFRIFETYYLEGQQPSYDGSIDQTVDLSKGILLTAAGNDGKTGYFKWINSTGEIPIVYKDCYVDKLQATDNQHNFIYREQRFDQSPRLMFRKGKKALSFFQSNPQQSQYKWGKSVLIYFLNGRGEKCKSVLIYPADYDPAKKYPMVVHVYEKQYRKLYKYVNPSLESDSGFNAAILTSRGYFVLYPDIINEQQNEGPSAVDYTVSATKEIISRGLVYPDKIGLIGHSYGGYETAYIITQTPLFAAAVAGSAIMDINSYYLSVNWELGRPTMNYFQNEQFKMVKSPFEIPEIYARNSPIVHADQITTPLLSFTGKQDNHVDWHQSVEFYMALRRIGKKHMMLIYPGEAHSILEPVNRTDLTQRVNQWFDYFLKDRKDASWINEGL